MTLRVLQYMVAEATQEDYERLREFEQAVWDQQNTDYRTKEYETAVSKIIRHAPLLRDLLKKTGIVP